MTIEKRIMLVDESSIPSNTISSILLPNYYFNKYDCIFNGIEELVTSQNSYDLLLFLNLNKSNLTPGNVVERIRFENKIKNLPIVYISPFPKYEDVDFFYFGGNSIIRRLEPKTRFLQKIEYLINSN